jgi:hypothetical protein
MTSREHARRLMLILLTSEGTALRKAADDRMLRREQSRPTRRIGEGIRGAGGMEVSGEARERGVEEWRLWAALPPLGAAPRAP